MLSILIIGSPYIGVSYRRAFRGFGEDCQFFLHPEETVTRKTLNKSDLVVFTGGEDVNPQMYGEEKHISTMCNPYRDEIEAEIFHSTLSLKKPMVGICRGAQFLTVMNGGKLVQNVNNHASSAGHYIEGVLPGISSNSKRRYKFQVTSTHHQMMYPYNLPNEVYKIVGFSENISTSMAGFPSEEPSKRVFTSSDGKLRGGKVVEPEVVVYPSTASLAVQYHPERAESTEMAVSFFRRAIQAYLFGEVAVI